MSPISYYSLIGVVTVAAIVHYVSVSRFQGIFTIDGIFVISQWIMAVGTLALLDPQDGRDSVYSAVITIPMLIYTAFSIFIYVVHRRPRSILSGMSRLTNAIRPTSTIVALLLLSIVTTIAYYQAVGYNVFLLGIRGLLTGVSSGSNYTELRIDSYASSRYLFPGYVNQFKNIILPALSVSTILYLFRTNRPHRKLISGVLILIALLGLLGTGQRGAFILFALSVITFLYYIDRKRFAKRVVLLLATVAPLIMFVTLLLGRSADQVATSTGTLGKAGVIGSELLKRFFYDNQYSGQMAFRYTSARPIQDGGEWKSSIISILPGYKQSELNLSQQIFVSLYGSGRGSAPPSMWGSVFYNFGWLGVVIIPIMLAVVYQTITYRAVRRAEMNSLEVIGMSGFFVVCGNWIVGGPEYLLNAGGLTFAVLWWIGRHSARINTLSPDDNLRIPPDDNLLVRRPASVFAADSHAGRTAPGNRT